MAEYKITIRPILVDAPLSDNGEPVIHFEWMVSKGELSIENILGSGVSLTEWESIKNAETFIKNYTPDSNILSPYTYLVHSQDPTC